MMATKLRRRDAVSPGSLGWPISDDDGGPAHDMAAYEQAATAIVGELKALGWKSEAEMYREADRRLKWEDFEVVL